MTGELTERLTALGRAHDVLRPLPGEQGKADQQQHEVGQHHPLVLHVQRKAFQAVAVDPDVAEQVRGVDADLRVRPFFAHGGKISIREFLIGAFNDEMGLQSVDPDLMQAKNGARVVTPSGMECLSCDAPREIADVEKAISQGRARAKGK